MYRFLLAFFCLTGFAATSQPLARIETMKQQINHANNSREKILATIKLAEYYSVFLLEQPADSLLQEAFALTDISGDKEYLLEELFKRNIFSPRNWTSTKESKQVAALLDKARIYAEDLKRPDLVTNCYIRLAGICRKTGQKENALKNITMALTSIGAEDLDSMRVPVYLELGEYYLSKDEAVQCYQNYNIAFRLAYQQKNIAQQSDVYHHYAELYRKFGDTSKAITMLRTSHDLNKSHNNLDGLFKDYIDLARVTDRKDYIDLAYDVAQKLQSDRYTLQAKRLMFIWYMVKGNNSKVTLNYLYNNLDVMQSFQNKGTAYFQWQVGLIYHYVQNYDSAIYYFRLAEDELTRNYDASMQASVYSSMGASFAGNKNWPEAKNYYGKAFQLMSISDNYNPSGIDTIGKHLAGIYAHENNFENAYSYYRQSDSAKGILEKSMALDKVILLGIDRENKKRESDLNDLQEKRDRKYGLQIMSITIAIALIFTGMLFAGMFAVSKTTIKLFGYFAFISLFEFIVLLIDHPIVAIANGEPVKIWGIKIFLIALLVPIQHFMEHGLIKFLQSRKLLEARQNFSFKKWLVRMRKPRAQQNDNLEEDTAVL
ncbi:MAG: tetratricopeptide repeat protein [Ferruginibacter sp.]|nr:tetratricopeptide repeat protein [Ferruginibacter sp.]